MAPRLARVILGVADLARASRFDEALGRTRSTHASAMHAGATPVKPAQDVFWGGSSSTLPIPTGPCGKWPETRG